MSNQPEAWVTTSTIFDGLHERSDGAWRRLVDRFRDPILRFAASLGLTTADSEDVVQETLIALQNALERGNYDRARGKLSRFLFGIAHNQIVKQKQKNAREAERVGSSLATSVMEGMSDERASRSIWERTWDESLWSLCLERARSEFEDPTFRAFHLVSQGASAAETATELDVPVKAVYNAKHRVLKRLRELREQIDEEL